MAEMSREEAIICIQNEHCTYCNHHEDEDCDYCYLGKSISDMQKLEKIEQVLDSSIFHPNSNKSSIELLGIVKNIYEIVKGKEE